MRALIIGGAGGMGQGVARDLVKQEQVTDVILADLYPDPERLIKANEPISTPSSSGKGSSSHHTTTLISVFDTRKKI